MSKREELTRELESLKNNGLIKSFEIFIQDGAAFGVSIFMHEKRKVEPRGVPEHAAMVDARAFVK